MTGEEGEPPSAINTSYSDYHTGVFQPSAIIGALMRRRMTGEPATMESSIFKSGAVTAGPAILDYQVNGRLPGRIANRGTDSAPPRRLPVRRGRSLVRHCRAGRGAVGRLPPRHWQP